MGMSGWKSLDLGTGALHPTSGHGISTCPQTALSGARGVRRHLSTNQVQAPYIFIGAFVRVICEEV